MRLSQCGSHAHLLLVWIDCLSCRPMIHSCLQLCFVITGRTLRCVRCVFGLVNDLLSMCNVLFPEHISAVSDVGPVSIFSFIHPVFSLFFVCLTHSAFSQLLLFFFFLHFHREKNVRKHSKPGAVPVVPEKEKHVVAVVK